MIWIAPSEKDTNNASLDYDAFGGITPNPISQN